VNNIKEKLDNIKKYLTFYTRIS